MRLVAYQTHRHPHREVFWPGLLIVAGCLVVVLTAFVALYLPGVFWFWPDWLTSGPPLWGR